MIMPFTLLGTRRDLGFIGICLAVSVHRPTRLTEYDKMKKGHVGPQYGILGNIVSNLSVLPQRI